MSDCIKDWLPIIISVVAIIVTLFTVYRQNKIALFEIRYKAFNVLSYLLSVTDTILKEDSQSTKVILYQSMETYRASTTLSDTISNGDEVSSFYTGLVFEAGKVEHIFKKKHTGDIMQFLVAFNDLVSCTYIKKNYEAELEQLRSEYEKIARRDISKKLKSYIKL